jgi:hypothetical protein
VADHWPTRNALAEVEHLTASVPVDIEHNEGGSSGRVNDRKQTGIVERDDVSDRPVRRRLDDSLEAAADGIDYKDAAVVRRKKEAPTIARERQVEDLSSDAERPAPAGREINDGQLVRRIGRRRGCRHKDRGHRWTRR